MKKTQQIKHLFFNEEKVGPDLLQLGTSHVCYYSKKKPSGRQKNGDCFGIVRLNSGAIFLILADGAGGTPRGNDASRVAVEAVIDCILSSSKRAKLRERILDGFELANEKIRSRLPGAGTTLFVAQMEKNKMRTYHVGDSVVLLSGQRGQLRYQTVAHSPTSYAVEAGVINEREALRDESRSDVSNLVGSADMRIEVGPELEMERKDTLLIASDGVTDNLTTVETVQIMRKGPLDEVAKVLTQKLNYRMTQPDIARFHHPDDCTFVLFRFGKILPT